MLVEHDVLDQDFRLTASVTEAWQVIDPLRFTPGRGGPAAPLAELLALAPPELAV
jgi:hypothetical protein